MDSSGWSHRQKAQRGGTIATTSWISLVYKWKNHFFKMKGGYRDGLKHQKGRNKESLNSKVAQSHMTPSLYLCFIVYKQSLISNKDIGMVSCGFVPLCCIMTPCFFLFGASSHPYIPLSFWRNEFSTCFHYFCYSHSDVHGYVVDRLP